MIVVDVEQGSREWFKARAGVVTASCAEKILTKSKLQPAKAEAYLNQLVAEILLGRPVDDGADDRRVSGYAERGSVLEPAAVRWYEFRQDVDTTTVGFVLREDRRLGASPDRLCGQDGGVQIKVPSAAEHVANLRDPERFELDHRGQVQVELLVTGRQWWDLVSWNSVLPSLVRRVRPDPVYVEKFQSALATFLADVDVAVARIRATDERYVTTANGERVPCPI